MSTKPKISVAKYLEQQIAVCGKSQREIAAEIGYTNPNIMTMFKTGATKIPLTKVALLAKSLSVDPAYLLRLAMSEYMPEAWEAIEGILGKDKIMSEQDLEITKLARKAADGLPLDMSLPENQKTFMEAIKSIASRDQDKANASVRRINALPPNSRNK